MKEQLTLKMSSEPSSFCSFLLSKLAWLQLVDQIWVELRQRSIMSLILSIIHLPLMLLVMITIKKKQDLTSLQFKEKLSSKTSGLDILQEKRISLSKVLT